MYFEWLVIIDDTISSCMYARRLNVPRSSSVVKEKIFKTSKATIVVKLKGRGGSEAEILGAVEELAVRLREALQKAA